MSLPALLEQRLRLPVVAAPMFLVSNPQLVLACCNSGIVGSVQPGDQTFVAGALARCQIGHRGRRDEQPILLAQAGIAPLLMPGIIKTSVFIFVAPLLGMLLSGLIIVGVSWLCRRRSQRMTDRWFRRLQLVSSALYSVDHGTNDAQKTMGII